MVEIVATVHVGVVVVARSTYLIGNQKADWRSRANRLFLCLYLVRFKAIRGRRKAGLRAQGRRPGSVTLSSPGIPMTLWASKGN